MAAQVLLDKIDHHSQLSFGELVAKRRHPIAALGDMLIDLAAGLKLKIAVAQVWYLLAVIERFALALRAVTDRAVLAKQRGLVSLALSNIETRGF